jgi:hypothetical protein
LLVSANFKAAQKPEFTPFFSSSQLKRSFQPTVRFKAIVYGGGMDSEQLRLPVDSAFVQVAVNSEDYRRPTDF